MVQLPSVPTPLHPTVTTTVMLVAPAGMLKSWEPLVKHALTPTGPRFVDTVKTAPVWAPCPTGVMAQVTVPAQAFPVPGRGKLGADAPVPDWLTVQGVQAAVVEVVLVDDVVVIDVVVVDVVVVVVVVDVVDDVVVVVVVVPPQVGAQHGVGRVGRVKQTHPFCCWSEYSVAVQVSRNGLQSVLSTHLVLVASSTQVETPRTRPQV